MCLYCICHLAGKRNLISFNHFESLQAQQSRTIIMIPVMHCGSVNMRLPFAQSGPRNPGKQWQCPEIHSPFPLQLVEQSSRTSVYSESCAQRKIQIGWIWNEWHLHLTLQDTSQYTNRCRSSKRPILIHREHKTKFLFKQLTNIRFGLDSFKITSASFILHQKTFKVSVHAKFTTIKSTARTRVFAEKCPP